MIVNNLKISLNCKEVLSSVSFTLFNNEKIGLVGINGSGKSTLLRVLAGEIQPDYGSIKLNGQTISYLKQEIPYIYYKKTIIDFIRQEIGIDILEKKLQDLQDNLNESNMSEYESVLNDYMAIDGYSFEYNLSNVLSGLNLTVNLQNKIEALSGGERIKVLLAIVLLQNSDILLFDEPTNNLDLNAIEWLESYLKSLNKKMLIVSHDEEFLNNIVSKIFELKGGQIHEYNMSYNDYKVQKQLEYEQMRDSYVKAQEQKEKLKKQIQKAKEWANKGVNKKAHNDNDKLSNNYAKETTNSGNVAKLTKSLQNLEIPEFDEIKPINVFFNTEFSKGNKDIVLDNLICGYDDFKLPEINFFIPFGTKVNIVGENGSGKSTLIKTIIGALNPIYGKVKKGNEVKIGYISQDTLTKDTEETIFEYLTHGKQDVDKSTVFMLLDKFSINYSDKNKLYKSLSPGERTRVNLVKLALDKINVLILDEVTNHLDSDALNLIYELVSNFKGTIISISHNRKYNEILNADIDFDIKSGHIIDKKVEHLK